MQDRYAGDIGDLGKFYLLRKLQKSFKIGINWYYTPKLDSDNSNEGELRDFSKIKKSDKDYVELVEKMQTIDKNNPSVKSLKELKLIDGAEYYSDVVERKTRVDWYNKSLKAMKGFEIVFLDPDNGLLCKSVAQGSEKSVKYVYYDEIGCYLKNGAKAVIVYNHRCRKKENAYFSDIFDNLSNVEIKDGQKIDRALIQAIVFPRFSIRDYIIISKDRDTHEKIREILAEMVKGEGKKPFCRLSNT